RYRAPSPHRTHNESRGRLYNIWKEMKQRCLNPRRIVYSYYGGRGIAICPEWVSSFEAFRDWALSNGYWSCLPLDRIHHDGDYSPANCRWANRAQQSRNTRKRRDARTSRFKGVSRHSQNAKWIAQIHTAGVTTYLGSFDVEIDAALAYDHAARGRFGNFAH